jgi:eukaryotic-like serine/threonine-protein kinase
LLIIGAANMHELNETLSPGAAIRSRYLVIDLLGKGGFSAVYLVQDLQGEKSFFALKEVITAHKKSSEHFTFEYSLLERLVHPALPRVHQIFDNEEHSRWYMLMDYVEGPNLETLRLIQHEKRFSLPVITAILAPVTDAIEYLHQQHPPIIHRDIKPSNIILPIVERKTVLVDFGIAKEYDTQGTTSAVRYGSHGYGAPEQYSAGTNTRTDIYGLGATLYTLLTGEVPAGALERMTQLSNDIPDPLKLPSELVPSIPLHASRAIQRALSINMMQRFATAQEFWQALQGEPGEPPRITEVPTSITVSPSAFGVSGKTGETSTHSPLVKQAPDRRSGKSLLLPILLVLLISVGIGASYWGFTAFREIQVATPTASHSTGTSQHPALTPMVDPTMASSATFTPNHYPHLATSYTGTIVDEQNVASQMTLTHIQQNNGLISGSFSGLQKSEPFSGLISTSKHLSFTVAASSGHRPLSFMGDVQSSGRLQGTFCAIDQSVSCILADVFGAWSATPVTTR